MKPKLLSSLTLTATALSALFIAILPYMAGVYPGGFFEDAAVGPLPLWILCLALIALLAVVFIGTLFQRHERANRP